MSAAVERLPDQLLGALPQRRVADRLVRLRREREPRRQAEPAVRLADLAEQRLDLVGQLVRADVEVRVVLDELADAGQPADSVPERSLRWSRPNSLKRSGRSRYERSCER